MILAAAMISCGSSSSTTSSLKPKAQSSGAEESNVADSVSAMGTGDLYYVDFDSSGNADVSFSGASPDAQYILIVQSTESSASNITVAGADESADPKGIFDNFLRDNEARLVDKNLNVASGDGAKFSASKAIGDTQTFRVLSSISSTTSYTEVTATEACRESSIILYVDNRVSDDTLSTADIATLCAQFESAVSSEIGILGNISDVNSDNHLSVLISPAVNALGASGGGIITGYFYASDLYQRTASNPTSNGMEIIYILSPDPNGTYGTTVSKDFAMSNLLPAVVPHELQHAISYNMHVFENGSSSEENWLNEAMSHFSEDLVGFGQENPSRVEIYLESPESTPLVTSSSPNIGERGAGYLFVRYMYERASSPNTFLSALENTTERGKDNIASAFNSSAADFDEWSEFVRRWAVAIAMTDLNISLTAQYQFNDRTYNSSTAHWQGVCLICSADDGRDTVLTGPSMQTLSGSTLQISLSGTSNAYYSITSAPSSLAIQGSASAGLQGVLIRTE